MAYKLTGGIAEQTACEACLLLNEAIRELGTPVHVLRLTQQWESINPLPIRAIGAVRNMLLRHCVINLYRLSETRTHFVVGWLFSDSELISFGFKRIEDFIGSDNWDAFVRVRHQYAGHATGTEATHKKPGRIIPASRLGEAIRRAGLLDLPELVRRIIAEVLPGVERVRDEITKQYPKAADFLENDYPIELEKASRGV